MSSSATIALLITVNYKSEQSTLDLLASLQRLNGFESLNLVIVDNCSGDDSISRLRLAIAAHSNVQLLVSENNRGYFGAARLGLDHFLVQGHELPEWIIVCNPDVIVPDTDFLVHLSAQDWRSVGVLAPRVTALANREQNPFLEKRPNYWRRLTMRFYASSYVCLLAWDWLSRQKQKLQAVTALSVPRKNGVRRAIYAGHGSFLIFSRKFFECGGHLDDSPFLFGEEITVAENCRRLVLPVIYEPKLRVVHEEHQSIGTRVSRATYGYHRQAVRHVFSQYLSHDSD